MRGAALLGVVVLALTATSLYGASDEWHQAFVPLRNSEIRDWVADTIGGAVGAVLYWVPGSVSARAKRAK